MPISLSSIRQASYKSANTRTINEAKAYNLPTAFLCHSHLDKDLVTGVINMLRSTGWDIYVDWNDEAMPEKPNQVTASRIKQKIKDMKFFLFLATPSSMKSRWCPWEIGYADGIKSNDNILIIPTEDSAGWYGNEYLDLYRKIDLEYGVLRAFQPNSSLGFNLKYL